jgi:uncharacterized SAM-binding protein YcdF (DUF218 family)
VLNAVRPSATRRSWWLREALAAEPGDAAGATAALVGSRTADVVIVGGGYTGLWTAWRLTELEPCARIVPDPLRHMGAQLIREAIVRTESARERGRRRSQVMHLISRLPRKLGYHLGSSGFAGSGGPVAAGLAAPANTRSEAAGRSRRKPVVV